MTCKSTTCHQAILWSLLIIFIGLPAITNAQAKWTNTQISERLDRMPQLKLEASDYDDFDITAQYTDDYSNITHVYLQQHFQGIDIEGATLGLHFDGSNSTVYNANHFLRNKTATLTMRKPQLDAAEAVATVFRDLDWPIGKDLPILQRPSTADKATVFAKTDFVNLNIPARLVFYPNAEGKYDLAWKVEVYPLDQQNYWVYTIDAENGAVLNRFDQVIHCSFGPAPHDHDAACTAGHAADHLVGIPEAAPAFETEAFNTDNFYRVYDFPVEAPTFGDRSLVGTAGNAAASPLGWHDDGLLEYNITKGNNVYAYQDPGPGSTGIPAVGGLPGQQPLVFDFPLDLSQNPIVYRDAAITNLFYWNNLIHDMFYDYGFTETAGNFQTNNFDRGGEGNDAVLAEAQDGSGVNNANFLTLADGLPGRMQMFLWNTAIPLIDGDLDNGVILHEYGHGISTRLTGGPAATCLGGDEQGGEGWSDFFGYMMTMDPGTVPGIFASGRGIGNYVLNQPNDAEGIRPAPYSTDFAINDYTYGDVTASNITVPHGVGFIWSTMLWEMTAKLVEVYGYDSDVVNGSGGNNIALQLVMDGLKLQPCSPTFVEQRDAILAADQILYGGANQCLIWEAFAKRGLGFSASSGTNALGDEVEAFDMPPSLCLPTVMIRSEVDNEVQDGDNLTIRIFVDNTADTPISGVTVSNALPTGTSYVNSSHSASVSGQTVTFNNLTIPANTTEEITITANANTGSQASFVFNDDLENNPFNWTASPGLDQFVWSNADAFDGEYSYFCPNPNNFSNMTLTLNNPVMITEGTALRFAHRYNTEQGFDGGRIEASTDGVTWLDLGSALVENGYTDFVPAANNPLINGFCFGGNSGGFIHSVAELDQYVGSEMFLRFRFASDVLTAAEGWFIDDIQFVQNPVVVHNVASFSMVGGAISDSVEEQILVLGPNANLQGQNRTVELGATIDPQATKDASMLNVMLAPNPATSAVNIMIQAPTTEEIDIRMTNVHGQLVRQWTTTERNQSINVSDFASGIYIVQVYQNGQVNTQRLVIQ